MKIIKITAFEKEIWWQWAWDYWRIAIELHFDLKEYKYISFRFIPLLFAIRLYVEWE